MCRYVYRYTYPPRTRHLCGTVPNTGSRVYYSPSRLKGLATFRYRVPQLDEFFFRKILTTATHDGLVALDVSTMRRTCLPHCMPSYIPTIDLTLSVREPAAMPQTPCSFHSSWIFLTSATPHTGGSVQLYGNTPSISILRVSSTVR